MGKGHRHLKNLKAERAKVKLKGTKAKQLPKGLNVTNPTFKVKKIVIREQLKQRVETEILSSRRKLNVKDLLSRLQHHNTTVRQDAIRELKEILSQYIPELLSSQFGSLMQGICALSLDKERVVRHDSFKVLGLILGPVSNDQLSPYHDVLISHLRCAMTHIDPYIKEDSLLFLDLLVQNCSNVLATNSRKVLPSFLDMISKLHTDTKPGRQLITTLNTKNTNVKWRIKVLERLATMFNSIVNFYKSREIVSNNENTRIVYINESTRYIPVYRSTNFQPSEIDFEQNDNKESSSEKIFDAEELMKYIQVLMPLIFESWIEACPEEKNVNNSALLLSSEALDLLKSAIDIMQSIIECIDILHVECDANMKYWFKSNFQNAYIKNLLSRFPYNKLHAAGSFLTSIRNRKRQQDFIAEEVHDACLEHNLGLCQIYVWFTSIYNNDNKKLPKLNENYATSIIGYLNEKLENWSSANNSALPQLIKLLRTLLLKASKVWCGNRVDLNKTLQLVVNACSNQSKKEMQLQLFSVISDTVLDHTLYELHREIAFKEFVSTLPRLLLKAKIHESTIQIINKVVLRYRHWIQKELAANHEQIIENAKKIEIVGSGNEKQLRLMICNLFYFLDSEIFY